MRWNFQFDIFKREFFLFFGGKIVRIALRKRKPLDCFFFFWCLCLLGKEKWVKWFFIFFRLITRVQNKKKKINCKNSWNYKKKLKLKLKLPRSNFFFCCPPPSPTVPRTRTRTRYTKATRFCSRNKIMNKQNENFLSYSP